MAHRDEVYIILPQNSEAEVVRASTKTAIETYAKQKYAGLGFMLIGPIGITDVAYN